MQSLTTTPLSLDHMLPDNRLCIRKSLQVNALMNYPALGLIQVTIENIGILGVFVKTEHVSLHVGAALELSFKVEGMILTNVKGTIVRYASEGVGIMFQQMEDRLALIHDETKYL